MGTYDGGQAPADGSGWDQPVMYAKDGEPHPEPASFTQGVRDVTPDPYTPGNGNVLRNFGKQG